MDAFGANPVVMEFYREGKWRGSIGFEGLCLLVIPAVGEGEAIKKLLGVPYKIDTGISETEQFLEPWLYYVDVIFSVRCLELRDPKKPLYLLELKVEDDVIEVQASLHTRWLHGGELETINPTTWTTIKVRPGSLKSIFN